MNLVDFHCHLDLYPDFEQLVDDVEAAEIFTLGVTTTPKAWPRNRDLTRDKKYVRSALGLHPQVVKDRYMELELFEAYLPETRYVGEVGLDASRQHYGSFDLQKEAFTRILQLCAQQPKKLLSIHSVRAASTVLSLLEEHLPIDKGQPVLHWFSGSKKEAQRALEFGCYFSVNHKMLSTDRLSRIVADLPIERVLTETDGPFVASGNVPCKPGKVKSSLKLLAGVFACSEEYIKNRVAVNCATLVQSLDPNVAH